jgi:Arc/MetJ-type ribon-helix-helix transcriptional regulator
MTSLVSIRLNDRLLQAIKVNAHLLHLSKTEYIRKAIELMNAETENQKQKERLKNASFLVRKESMKINAEFEDIEHGPKP